MKSGVHFELHYPGSCHLRSVHSQNLGNLMTSLAFVASRTNLETVKIIGRGANKAFKGCGVTLFVSIVLSPENEYQLLGYQIHFTQISLARLFKKSQNICT